MFKPSPSALFVSLCLSGASIALALDNPAAPPPVKNVGDAAARSVAAETTAAIRALGADPSTKKISAIVFHAVRSSPDNVLPIVDAAVRVSPKNAATEIVTAATAALPNPWKEVSYNRLASLHGKRSGPDYKGAPDGKQARDGGRGVDLAGGPADPNAAGGAHPASGNGAGDPGSNAAGGSTAAGSGLSNVSSSGARGAGPSAGDPSSGGAGDGGVTMTLAEAIAFTAFNAQPGLSFQGLLAAVDAALASDPTALMHYIQSPRTNTGVGTAGFSNYANEPLRTPFQPAVSR